MAPAGEVLVAGTVRDLEVGSGIAFDDRGRHNPKGVPDVCQVLAVERACARSPVQSGSAKASPVAHDLATGVRRVQSFLLLLSARRDALARPTHGLLHPKSRLKSP
jgi:hypothetical protein